VQEAEADLKAGKAERAVAGYWGALLLALCASNSDAAPYLSLSKARKIVPPEKDKDNKPIEDPAQFKKVLWKTLERSLGDPVWTGKWRFVGFTLDPTANFRTVLEPERSPDKADFGGGRRWQDLDLEPDPAPDVYRGNHDLGIDLRRWSGTAQVGYVMRDFEVPAAGETVLRLAACGSWFAWVDGKPVRENTNVTSFRFENDCIKLNLTAGKHRLLLKLEAPPDGPFAFRARISTEPELAVHLLVQALMARQFPLACPERRKDLQWLCDFAWGKTGTETPYTIAGATSQLFADQPWLRLETANWMLEHMRETGDITQAVATLRNEMALLETTPSYSDRGRHICDFSLRLFHALVAEGRTAAADAVLRSLCARRPDAGDAFFLAIALRGSLRRDSGQSQSALPFYEYVMRESPLAWRMQQRATVAGLDWCRTYRPERLMFETSHEAQAVLDAIRRQLAAGGAEDIERAMRNVTDILSSAPGALNRVADNPFYSRFVGVREYIRALLASLPDATRDVYRRVVEAASTRRLRTASELSDVTELEVLANEYYYTPAAEAARNRAGDIYFDRGQFAQAASLFSSVVRECDSARTPASAMLYGKLARALLADGQTAAAERTIERLRTQHGGENVKRGGETITGTRLAEGLKQVLDQCKASGSRTQSGDSGSDYATHMGNLSRTGVFHGPAPVPGPVVWAHPLIQQVSLRGSGGAFEPQVRSYVPCFPVVAGGRAFVSGLDSVRAIDLASGRILWTQAWGAGGPLLKGVFNGFPLSCPTVHAGNVYVRSLEGGVSSIRCYTADTGRPRWSSTAVPELRKAVWLSDPAVAHNLALAVFLEQGDMNAHGVAAVDADTGRLRWKTTLVTGSTGVKIGEQYYLSTLNMGPPAVDSGELYISTGLSAVAALNAFSGEVKWITTYPRLHLGDPQHGQSQAGYDLRQYTSKALSRGPLSPMVVEDVVLLAPKDGCGFLALDRQTGAIRWRMELADCRFVAGIADGTVLLCDEGVTAVSAASGRVVWEYSPANQSAYGQPALSGGVLYLPTEKELQRVDARTGQLLGATPWDSRLGPLTNLAIVSSGLIGVGENAIATLGPPDSKVAVLPLYEARELEAAGKLEAAAAAYARLQGSKDMGEVLHALAARVRILEKLGKREDALSALAALQAQTSETLSSFNGLWQVRKDAFARALRRRLGEQAPDASPPAAGTLAGVLTFAWQLPGENCTLIEAPEKPAVPVPPAVPAPPGDRCYVLAGNDMCCLRMGPQLDVVWRTYVGPGISRTVVGTTAIAAASEYKITVLDRATGETLGEMLAPAFLHKDTKRFETRRFDEFALGDNALVATDDATMYAWELSDGQSMWRRKMPGQRAVPGGLAVLGDKVLKVQGVKDERKNESILDTYDLKTGNQSQGLPLGGRGQAMMACFSPDCRRLLYRADTRVTCADVPQMKTLWQADLPRLESRQYLFEFQDDVIRYFGAENGKWHLLWLNSETGKEARPRISPGFAFRMNGDHAAEGQGEQG
ncbi:MAG: PQQ-binding-like beta-propeller repeat protein, partial [Planctomycetota bacterium]|nr:PQQ-binding-like beta-propeller repeat protein [Planctomycetota bacterium]